MSIIKCHICKLDKNTCQQACIEVDDIYPLKVVRPGWSE